MAITERDLPGGRWERKFTGDDIPKARGSLIESGNEAYKKAFHKDEGNWERISDPSGNPTVVPKDRVAEYQAVGYGRAGVTPTLVMPAVPWERKRTGPGRHRFRYDKASGQMVEVA